MNTLLLPFLNLELLFVAGASANLFIEPKEGSLAGGTWITLTLEGLTSPQVQFIYSTNGPWLEVSLVNPVLPPVRCDVHPVYFDLSIIRCKTRSSPQEGLYQLEVTANGQVISNLSGVLCDNCTFKFAAAQTPVVYQINPPSGVPGNVIQVSGHIIAGRYESIDFKIDYIDGPVILEAEGDGWISLCSFANRRTRSIYPIQMDRGTGTLQCRVEGNYIGSQNVSFSVFNKGKSMVHKDAWLISAKQELFMYQTYSEIVSVFPVLGSLGGGSDLTITGDFFDQPVQVTVAGVLCEIKHHSPQKISCVTGCMDETRRLTAPQAGNRGLLFEVWDGAAGTNLTEAALGYRWQIVPNASTPEGFLSPEQQSFRSRLRGFFVAPETNNYTFWIQADGRASLHLSLSEDPAQKVKVASIPAGASKWSEHWEQNWNKSWQPKSQKLELLGGSKYYLEAWHHGKAPSSGMRVGVQLHNTWLNPDVVNTYLRERHEIRATAHRLPEIQMLTLSGTGWFHISWDNVSSDLLATNVTAAQVQTAIEELLSVKCEMKPLSAKFLLWKGFEEGQDVSATEGHVVSWTEPFCGRFSVYQPKHLVKMSLSTLPRYDLTEYTHVCFAYKGNVSNTLYVSVSYVNAFLNTMQKNFTCQWSLNETTPERWKFMCADLWRGCLNGSESLWDLEANSPVFVHQIDMLIPERGEETASSFYLDEIIIADRNVAVFQRDPRPARPGGNVIQEVCVMGSPPTFNVSLLVAGCGSDLPLLSLSRGAGSEDDDDLAVSTEGASVTLTVQRLQVASPPLGGTFRILLPSRVIPGIPVNISSYRLRELLQSNPENTTHQYFHTSDFTVTKDVSTCHQNVWTLTWNSMTGDLPIVINVSAENLTGLNPAIAARVVYDGGVFIGPIFGDMLATANNHTQVVVVVNDIPAHCSGSCTFHYSQEVTPLVSHVEYSLADGLHTRVSITGSGFAEDSHALQIEVNHTTCQVVTSNQTGIVCWMHVLPMGLYQVTLLVRPYGFARNATNGPAIYLRVKPTLEAIEPPTVSEIGRCPVILRGAGFDGINLVLFGSQPCPINTSTSNSMRIECEVPSRGDEEYSVPVTLTAGSQSAVFPLAFKYEPSLNPAVVLLSRNRSSVAGHLLLQIGISSFANYNDVDVQVIIGDTVAQIQAQTIDGVDVILPALAEGWYNISVIINGIVIGSRGVDLFIQYVTEVVSIEPCCGSVLGGTTLTISGKGFSQNPSLIAVLIGTETCHVIRLMEETILCQSQAAKFLNGESQDISAHVEVLIGNRSSLLPSWTFPKKNVTFTYQMALTPVVTSVEAEMTDNSLRLAIGGINATGAVAELGDSECELEFQYANGSTVLSQCSFPWSTLEPGIYPIRVLQKQVGYANVTAALRNLTLAPQVKAISPSHGSACGGLLLTISGLALKSGRNSVHVSLTGNYTCEVHSVAYNLISCALLPRGPPLGDWWLPDASQALNITVTVNGIPSICIGDCTLHLLEQGTPRVDAVDWEINGTLVSLLIRGQRLALATDELVILVDNHAPCNVTFWKETSLQCQTDSLSPGEHSLSVSNRRSGHACFSRGSHIFTIMPCVLKFYPHNFSINGGGLLTIQGTALQGRSNTSVLVGNQPCLITDASYVVLRCIVPFGNGAQVLALGIDGISYQLGEISYSEEFTPVFLFLPSPVGLLLTVTVSRITGVENMHITIGDSPCTSITGNRTTLQCLAPRLPAGEYQVLGGDFLRGRASSNLTFSSQLAVTSTHYNWGGLGGGAMQVHGTGFAPGNTSVTVCGAPCEVLGDMTTTDVSCLAPLLDASLAVLCALTHLSEDCKEAGATYIQCDIHITAGAYSLAGVMSYLYLCDDNSLDNKTKGNSSQAHFAGLFLSPKVERDEVLIYNSSCNITMETEAEMECEGANQPITAKITEIRKNWGQNTQKRLPLQFCGRWSKNSSWLDGHLPQDGDNVTVERGQTLLVDTTTGILNFLHVKGGKLLLAGPGPIEIHAHYILVSDGGEFQVGSRDKPLRDKAHIILYGSFRSATFFPYGAKFLAVRNGTISMHGWVPEIVFTHLKSAACINDTKLDLEEPVNWQPGDEVIVSGTGPGDMHRQEEIVTVKAVNNTEIYLGSPLRYPHSGGEEWVHGRRLASNAVVALLSRRIVVRGNITGERVSHLRKCAEAGVTGDASVCLYKRSERMVGSRDMGAVVIAQAFQGEDSHVRLEGVQFQHMGQAFKQHQSALTIAGDARMTDSYIHGCSVWDSLGRGLSLLRTSELRVDNNVFYNILGHGILLGGWLEQGNRVRHNMVIGLSGTDGLSNIETLSPAGIYIRAPANEIEGNTVCAAGYGYFFHLHPEGPSQTALLSFSENTAHSCTRYGLLVYPEYQPKRVHGLGPVLLQGFRAWRNQGGAQIFSSSNLELRNFHVYACKDFGIDIVESLGNSSVVNSFLLGHLGQKDGSCMSAGLKTPKRHELLVSNTTFMNFDISTCTAISTCSGCHQGQGGFTVRAEQLAFLNSPNQVSFPFPHSAILKDLDGSITGQEGSHLLASMDTLAASCVASANVSHTARGSVCGRDVIFHRMSIGLKEAPDFPYNLTVTDSKNKTTTVHYVSDTLSNLHGWMALLLDQETYTLTFGNNLVSKQLQYSATFSNFIAGNYLLVEHANLPSYVEVMVSCGIRPGQPLQSLPSHHDNKGCDWFFNSKLGKLTYLVTGEDLIQVTLKEEDKVPLPVPAPVSPPDIMLKWSFPESWSGVRQGWGGYNHSIPAPGEDVIILPNRTILVDTTLPPLRGLYVLGTLEFPVNSSNVLSATCIVVAGGELKVGTLQHPLETGVKLLILLRASEGVYCDRLDGISVRPGTIGVYGKVQIHSAYPTKSWTHLGSDIAPGNERIWVEDEVDWSPGGNIVISSSSYDAHQAEVVTLKEINGRSIKFQERLLHRHIEVTFSGFTKSCYSDDRDVCIMSNPDSMGIMFPITAERMRMSLVHEQNKFYFHTLQTSINGSTDFAPLEMGCEGSRKALFKDLDGSALGLPPPVSVFPKSESDWTESCLHAGIYRDDTKCIFKPTTRGYYCKDTDHALVILESLDSATERRRPSSVVSVTGSFVEAFSSEVLHESCCPSDHPQAFYSVLSSNRLTKVCFTCLTPPTLRLRLISGQNSTRLLIAIFYDEPRSSQVFIKGNYIPLVSSSSSSFSTNAMAGTHYFSFENNLLYILLHGDDPIEIHTGFSLHAAFTISETIGEEGQRRVVHRLADFLQIGHDDVRIVQSASGSENTLKVIADNVSKRSRQCPPVTSCSAFCNRAVWGKTQTGAASMRVLQPSQSAAPLRVLIIEIGEAPGLLRNEHVPSWPSDRLKSLASAIINAQQVGDLQQALELPIDTLMVTQSALSSPLEGCAGRNGSSPAPGGCLYVRPYNISVQVQPSDGEMEKELPVQPQIVFLDKQGRRVEALGLPSEPWVMTACLKGSSEAVLKGHTTIEVRDGWASFTNLAISSSGSNWYLIFTVISPPGADFTVKSRPFTIFPIPVGEKSSMVLAAVLGSVASVLVLGLLLFCWSKKSKSNKPKTELANVLRAKRNIKSSQILPQQHSTCVDLHRAPEGNKRDIPGMGADMEANGVPGNTVRERKELHQQTMKAVSVRKMSTVEHKRKSGENSSKARRHDSRHLLNGRTALWGSLELQQHRANEFWDWKDTRQQLFACTRGQEIGGGEPMCQNGNREREGTAVVS
ncbi:fibrocystin isoform X12 [Pelodiscus sinensis]|uniref:fibrocystin isoform X12 n=1 Tax=Pelodiscus sinensis TaxID=13735 RepID=UPI003F6A93BC